MGKTAQVQHVFKTYDVSIRISGDNWCLNPLLCTVVGKSSSSSGSDDDDSGQFVFHLFCFAFYQIENKIIIAPNQDLF